MERFESDSQAGRLLVVDDDELVLRSMRRALARSGYEVAVAESGAEAVEVLHGASFDVAILDLALPDLSGFDLLRAIKAHDPTIQCIIFTGHTSAPTALEAYDAGAVEFFEKPITDWQRFVEVVERAVKLRRSAQERELEEPDAGDEATLRRRFTGSSRAIADLRRDVARAMRRTGHVLVWGPEGAGRTVVAELLHEHGRERDCIVVDAAELAAEGVRGLCGAVDGGEVVPGLLDLASGATLVIRDLQLVPLDVQEVLASILHRGAWIRAGSDEPQPLRTRVIGVLPDAPDRLRDAGALRPVLAGRFDLRIRVPGLEARVEDIPQLVYHYLRQANAAHGLDIRRVPNEVLQRFIGHDWRVGQVRGLGTAVITAALASRGDVLELSALPDALQERDAPRLESLPGRLPERYRGLTYVDFKERLLSDWMALYVLDLLEATGGNVTRAAKLAELHRPNFRRLMKRYGIEAQEGSDTSED